MDIFEIPRPKPVASVNQQAVYGQVVHDPGYTYSGERQSGSSQADVQQAWEGLVLGRECSRNAVESGSGKVVTTAEIIAQQRSTRGEVFAPLSLPVPSAANAAKMTSASVQGGISSSLPNPNDPIAGTSFQPQGLMLRGAPEGEQTSTLTSDTKSEILDNSGGPV
ncbi:hypothetical protein R1flu_018938 [Riccia fluitans]|uniref:Uncharacterized protein n=1 Tax=Riccia fluitans TaxID=41844 RepID=A0ABD1ZIQ7_9MARC